VKRTLVTGLRDENGGEYVGKEAAEKVEAANASRAEARSILCRSPGDSVFFPRVPSDESLGFLMASR
jgi:hypothetical protein